jgi:hypothetical protein
MQIEPESATQEILHICYCSWRKIKLMVLSLLAPEIFLGLAYAAFVEARWNRRENSPSSDEGVEAWSLERAYFANMGGFVIDFRSLKKKADKNSRRLLQTRISSEPDVDSVAANPTDTGTKPLRATESRDTVRQFTEDHMMFMHIHHDEPEPQTPSTPNNRGSTNVESLENSDTEASAVECVEEADEKTFTAFQLRRPGLAGMRQKKDKKSLAILDQKYSLAALAFQWSTAPWKTGKAEWQADERNAALVKAAMIEAPAYFVSHFSAHYYFALAGLQGNVWYLSAR